MGSGVTGNARRAELAHFLRIRRAAISPGEAGIEVTGRRRTPGLRREEVAQRAGVGLSWYTWLEQGRNVTPSAQVLAAVGRALRLSPAEQDHLFVLADVPPPVPADDAPVDDETAMLVRALAPHPAFVIDPRFDVLAHNHAAEVIMGGLLTGPPERRNLLRWMFDPAAGWDETAETWRATARANLLDFRAEYARHAGDRAFAALVDELSGVSELFRGWWAEHQVNVLEPTYKVIPHAALGPLRFLTTQARPVHRPSLRLRILVPADDATRSALSSGI